MTEPIYAVGDIHGQLELLNRALDLIAADGGAQAQIVFLGDLVDRGPDSRGVIDRLVQGQSKGKPWQVIRGNHDNMFARFLSCGDINDPRVVSGVAWTNPRLGGLATLASYGVKADETTPIPNLQRAANAAVPDSHKAFLNALPRMVQHGELLFVHAGIAPGVPLDRQDPDDLIWIRGPFLDDPTVHPWLVVHGHTALEAPQHFGNRIDLDGGAGYGRPIHPAVFQGRDCWLLTDRGRVQLTP